METHRSAAAPMHTQEVDNNVVAAVASTNAAPNTTRVFLRVKRKRRVRQDEYSIANANNTSNSIDNTNIAPDRIELALPCISTGDNLNVGGANKKKRRKLAQKDELALIERLDSTNLHENANNRVNDIASTTSSAVEGNNNSVLCTPARRGAGGGGNNPYDLHHNVSSSFSSTTMNHNGAATTSNDEILAPPMKPKRTVMFRKITDLQKRLLDNPKDGESTPTTDFNAANVCASTSSSFDITSDQEKSKWLRVVDVMLKEEEEEESGSGSEGGQSNNDNNSQQSTPKMNNNKMGESLSTIPKILSGGGQRVRRMRPRPSDEEEKKSGDDDNDETENNDGGRRQKKRRKLGMVVEQSRSILESDFYQGTAANTSSFNSIQFTAVTNHGLEPDTIRLIEFSLSALLQQNGGSVAPHIAFLHHDPRLKGRGKLLINYALGDSTPVATNGSPNCVGMEKERGRYENNEGRGQTVLHLAALFGDLAGVRTLLNELDADPTAVDAKGSTPAMMARKGLHDIMGSDASSQMRRGSYNVIEALIGGKVQSRQLAIATSMTQRGATNILNPETIQLIEQSLLTVQQQKSVAPYLSSLKSDTRYGYYPGTERGRMIVDYALSSGDNKGQTALHMAALFGDFVGVQTLLHEMRANPTLLDARGKTPAMLGGYNAVVDVLVEGEKKWKEKANMNTTSQHQPVKNGDDGEYYYEVYCLETTAESRKSDAQFLRHKGMDSTINMDSIPGLELSSVLSEDDTATDSSGGGMNNNKQCALIELQQGFGYWNEKGELILESDDAAKQNGRDGQQNYHNGDMMDGGDNDSMMAGDEDDHDSNDEGYGGNDYPDDDISYGLGDPNDSDYDDYRDADAYNYQYSDDESMEDDNWKIDFRNRYVSKDALTQFDFGNGE